MVLISKSNYTGFEYMLQRSFSVGEIAEEIYIGIICFHTPVFWWIVDFFGGQFIYDKHRKKKKEKRNLRGVSWTLYFVRFITTYV